MSDASSAVLSPETMGSGEVEQAIVGAEDLLNAASTVGGEKGVELRALAVKQLKALREKMHSAQSAVSAQSKVAVRATDAYVHEHPWRVIAGAVGVGVVLGLLINRR